MLVGDSNLPLPFIERKNEKRAEILTEEFRGSVLMTGATGFLGPFILRSILRTSPNISVVCVAVRAKTKDEACQRVFDRLQQIAPKEIDSFKQRVEVINGDLSEKRFGLTEKRWNTLKQNVSFVIGNGSFFVSFFVL